MHTAIGGGTAALGGHMGARLVDATPPTNLETLTGIQCQTVERLYELEGLLDQLAFSLYGSPSASGTSGQPEKRATPSGVVQTALDVRSLTMICRDKVAGLLQAIG